MKAIYKRFRRHGGGFTLIELLVVIVIIIILMGIALQVAKTANERTRRAQTVRTMEALRNALAAYYSAYGQYPPTYGTAGTYPSGDGISALSGANLTEQENLPTDAYNHGLLFYLMAYRGPTNDPSSSVAGPAWFPHKPERDAAQRWQHYLEDGIDKNGNVIYVPGIRPIDYATNLDLHFSTGIKGTTNTTFYASDGWGSSIGYTSSPPDYQSFRLWSDHMTNGWEE